MRLIDADALHERVQETMEAGLIFSGMTIAEFIHALVDEAPTIEAEPVRIEERKEGRWIGMDSEAMNYDDYKCSNCRHEISVDHKRFCDIGFVIEDFKYCPNCGAKMEVAE